MSIGGSTTLYFDNYRDSCRVFRDTVTALDDNPVIAKVYYSRGAEAIQFRNGHRLQFRVVAFADIQAVVDFPDRTVATPEGRRPE